MPQGKEREAIDELTKSIGKYIHSGRHVVPILAVSRPASFRLISEMPYSCTI